MVAVDTLKVLEFPKIMACSKLSMEKQVLMDNRDFIVNYLEADDITDQLIQARLISQNAAESLIGKSKVDKNRIVFEQLSNGGAGTLEKFREILKNQRRKTDKSKQLEKRKLIRIITVESKALPEL